MWEAARHGLTPSPVCSSLTRSRCVGRGGRRRRAPDPLLAVDELRPPPPAAAEDVLLSSSDGQSPPPDAVALLLHSIVVRVVSLADLGLVCPQANAMRTPQERNFLVDAGH
jgi:hypothetical protein